MSIYSTRESKNQKSGPSGVLKRGGTSEIVNIFVAVEGGILWRKNKFLKKRRGKIFSESLAVPKKIKGGPFGLARYGMLRGKTGKTYLVQFLAKWCNNIL